MKRTQHCLAIKEHEPDQRATESQKAVKLGKAEQHDPEEDERAEQLGKAEQHEDPTTGG